jgi:ABC-type Mn2+/Zn2+ transport system ATPase subunit
MTNKDSIISATNLSAKFKNKTVWSGANFEIGKGELVGIIGPNGAGKTTLIKIILGLNQQSTGGIHVFGNAPRKGNNRISYVPQTRSIDQDSRIEALEFVKMGISANYFGFSLNPKTVLKKALEALRST